MSVFERRPGEWVSKFQYRKKPRWTPGSPWPSEEMAKAAEDQYRAKLKGQLSDETCASFAQRWPEEWPRKAASTRKLYTQAADRFADEFGPTPLGDVERLSARTWALGIPRNISKILGTMYEDARNIGLVSHNPFSNLRLPATEKTAEVAPPTAEEWIALLHACTVHGGYGPEFRALIEFDAEQGLRAGEIQGLKWADIGTSEMEVRRARKDDGTYGLPKNGKPRTIALTPVAAGALERVPRRSGSEFVFHTIRGKPLNKSNLYYLWNRVRDNSGTTLARVEEGVPVVRFHDLRHLNATRLLEMGLDHFAVSVHLGHEDGGALVMSRYGHPSKEAARARLLALYEAPEFGTGSSATRTVSL